MPHFKWSTQVKQSDWKAEPRLARVGFDADTEVAHWGYGFADGWTSADGVGGEYENAAAEASWLQVGVGAAAGSLTAPRATSHDGASYGKKGKRQR